MKRKTDSFTGSRPVFTGSPSIVPGGFNLDVTNQSFNVGDIIPIGSVATFNEQTRLVQILKTAEVVEIDSDDAKKVSLKFCLSWLHCSLLCYSIYHLKKIIVNNHVRPNMWNKQ